MATKTNTTKRTAAAKPATAKPARGKRADAKPAASPVPVVAPAPVPVPEPVAAAVNVHAAARAAAVARLDAAIAAGETTVYRPYAADARGVGNKHRVYIEWCQRVNGERVRIAVDANGKPVTGVDGRPTLRTEPIDPATATDYADVMIASNACGVTYDTVRGWVSHWLRHPACRPGGDARGIPKSMRVHRCDPQFHAGDRDKCRAAMRSYVQSDAKRVHDATPDA